MIQNPVLRKELLIRMRLRSLASAKAGILAVILLVVGWIHYEAISSMLSSDSMSRGYDELRLLIAGQTILLFLLTPIAAANAITQEKEQQTWEMLVFTRLTNAEIIFGKLIARLVPSFVLMILAFPLTLFAFSLAMQNRSGWAQLHFGNLVACYAVLIITTIFFTTVGLFISWLVKRTIFAVMGAYTFVVGFLMVGTYIITGAASQFSPERSSGFWEWFPLLWINPIYLMGQAMEPAKPYGFLYMTLGLFAYVILTVSMLGIMWLKFHRSSSMVGG